MEVYARAEKTLTRSVQDVICPILRELKANRERVLWQCKTTYTQKHG